MLVKTGWMPTRITNWKLCKQIFIVFTWIAYHFAHSRDQARTVQLDEQHVSLAKDGIIQRTSNILVDSPISHLLRHLLTSTLHV